MFWMLLAFYFSHNILFERKLSNYLLAGVFTGIATATKYNGLAIGLTIVVAHFLSFSSFSWRLIKDEWQELFFSKKLILGLIMVVIGFVVGSPFSVLDYHTFTSDFMYNYMVAPVYEGQTGHSYAKFFSVLIEILGLPAFLLFSIAALVSLYLALSNKELPIERDTVWLSFSVLLIYYLKFAPFPRLETRFVLPIVPLLLIMSAPFWNKLKPYKMALSIFLVGLLGYNLVCSFYVGQRFLEDPRVEAEAWVRANMPSNSTIESDIYSPGWNVISGVQVQEVLTPYVTGRERLFRYIFKGNTFINGSEDNTKEVDEMVSWYSLEKLTERQPDFVVIDSLYYHRFTEPGLRRDLYPSMNHFYQALLNEEYPYEIVFDQETRSVPVWIYPQDIDFLHNRITIFGKK
jgi:4-amino-4-deoxy-L-arabinose transferase-like glycosyltransferase